MDPLTQAITLLRPKALNWKHAEASGNWTKQFQKTEGVAFCLIAEGTCRLQVSGQVSKPLQQGDFLLLNAPPEWTLAEGAASPADENGSVTRIFGGHFTFDTANAALLKGLLPAEVIVRSSDPAAARLCGLLDLIGDEALSDRPGRTLMLERLLEAMLVEAIRYAANQINEVRSGLLAGLADTQIAASLRALHADMRHSWTVAQLAAVAGMSRSVFAERFGRIVGLPPIDYLLQWRMAQAKEALRAGHSSLSQIAFDCGYQSVSAFSTAFSRTAGCPPARYASLHGLHRD
ncbi:AraC family transcriptional regulator [Undibacterium sp. TJN25]|uniref:AraC family transcriptional regulator n=1 Tax=Undibacterium sp. TJN25 TaxID=3413056 RepID=UPI003BF3EB67